MENNFPKMIKLYRSYVEDVIRCIPEHIESISSVLDNITSNNTFDQMNEMNKLVECLSPYFVRIQNKDDTLITSDNIEIIPGVRINEYWNQMSNKTKDTLWKYLQIFVLWSLKVIENRKNISNQDISDIQNNVMSGLKKLSESNDLSDIDVKKMLDRLREHSGNNNNEGMDMSSFDLSAMLSIMNSMKNNMGDVSGGGFFDENLMKHAEEMMNNSKIGGLAKDLMSDIDLEGLSKELGVDKLKDEKNFDMNKMLKTVMNARNSKTMQKMFSNIGQKIESKVKSGELKTDELMKETMEMMGKLQKTNNPLMKMATGMFNQNMRKAKIYDRLRKKRDILEEERNKNENIESFPDRENIARNNLSNEGDDNVSNEKKKKSRGRRGGKKHKNKNKRD
jgi:hypothetical protein